MNINNIYLATIKYQVTHYMGSDYTYDQVRIVFANNEEEAEKKVIEHFESKTVIFDVYYKVLNVQITKSII